MQSIKKHAFPLHIWDAAWELLWSLYAYDFSLSNWKSSKPSSGTSALAGGAGSTVVGTWAPPSPLGALLFSFVRWQWGFRCSVIFFPPPRFSNQIRKEKHVHGTLQTMLVLFKSSLQFSSGTEESVHFSGLSCIWLRAALWGISRKFHKVSCFISQIVHKWYVIFCNIFALVMI